MKDTWQNTWGFFTEADALIFDEWAKDVPSNGVIVELGSLLGRSAGALCAALERNGKTGVTVYCIDRWPLVGQDHSWCKQFPRLWTDYKGNPMAAFVVNTMSCRPVPKIMQYDVRVAARLFKPGSVWAVYIDADHSYDGMVQTIPAWWPRIVTGGRLGGHDYCSEWPGVVQAVDETFQTAIARYGISWEARKPTQAFAI